MIITIEISDADAAVLWLNGTWGCLRNKPVTKVVQDLVDEGVGKIRRGLRLTPEHDEQLLANFREKGGEV